MSFQQFIKPGAAIHSFILDFDGVVADTETVFAAFDCDNLNAVLEQAGHAPDLTPADARKLAGMSDIRKLEAIAQRYGFAAADYQAAYVAARTQARASLFLTHKVTRGKGLEAFLKAHPGAYALATGKRAAKLLPDLKTMGLEDLFPHIVTCDPPLREKPAPDVILKALEMLDAAPDTSAYIGDNVIDMQAAKAAGVTAIGFVIEGLAGHEVRVAEMKNAGAMLVTDDFADLMAFSVRAPA